MPMFEIRRAVMCGAALALALAACGEPIEPIPPGDVDLVAGTAQPDGSGFVEVEDGVDAELIPGAQGGFHVWLGMRVRGVAGELYVEREARRVSDGQLVFRGLAQLVEIPPEAIDEFWDNERAAPAFMCPAPVGLTVFDQELAFEIRLLTDFEDGEVLATDRVIMIPRCPEGEQNQFCLDICAG